MSFDPFTAILNVGGQLIDKFIPDPEARDKAKLELLKQQQAGKLEDLKIGMSAIVAEAKSSDPWTSRARPMFLYVMYVMILCAIPMGLLSAWKPLIAKAISTGVSEYLGALPSYMWQTFGLGYGGYAIARSVDKKKG